MFPHPEMSFDLSRGLEYREGNAHFRRRERERIYGKVDSLYFLALSLGTKDICIS